MSAERGKPFVGWMSEHAVRQYVAHGGNASIYSGRGDIPVVVTPLLPDDPRPGETWVGTRTGRTLKIVGAPYFDVNEKVWLVPTDDGVGYGGCAYALDYLRRPPVLKTFRLTAWSDTGPVFHITAENKEAALAKLSDALEEVDS